jgi:hypothetical protein
MLLYELSREQVRPELNLLAHYLNDELSD